MRGVKRQDARRLEEQKDREGRLRTTMRLVIHSVSSHRGRGWEDCMVENIVAGHELMVYQGCTDGAICLADVDVVAQHKH